MNFRFEDSPEGKLNETVTAAAGAYERESMARQNRQKSIARLEQGFAVQSIPPVGYRYNRSSVGGQVLERDEPNASIVQEALEGYATGRFASHVEVRRFLETHPQFPKAENGKIHKMFVIRMLRQCLYAGFVESKAFGVSIRKGKHSGLISVDTYERILNRLDQKAYAPTRKDIKQDFPLRGAVCCSECNTILTAGWCKGKRQKYPYYFCRKKGCSQYGRMIRRDVIEREFTELLADLKPSRGVVRSAARMFADLWEHQARQAKAVADRLNSEIRDIEGKIDQLVENTLHVSKGRVLGAIEARIDQLEREKLILQEKAANSGRPIKSFEEMFEHSMSFLTNPCKLWDSGCFDLQRTVLKLVFSEPIKYRRKEGFRTPQTALPFQLLNQISHSTAPEKEQHFQRLAGGSAMGGASPCGGAKKVSSESKCKLVLPERFELSTSPLPRECSTPELRQQAGADCENPMSGEAARTVPQGRAKRKRHDRRLPYAFLAHPASARKCE